MIKSDGISVATTATELTANVDVDGEYILEIRSALSGPDFQVGDSAVVYGAGIPVGNGERFTLRLQAGTRVYAASQTGSKTVYVLAYSA